MFFPRRFTKPSRCERGTRRSGGKQAHLAPDLKSRSGTSQSNVAIWSNNFKRIHTRPSSRREEPTGGGHAIVVPDRSVPRLSPPDSGTLPRLHGLYNLLATGGVHLAGRHSGGGRPSERETPSPGMCSEGWAPQSPWTAFSAASGESGCNKSTNFQQDWRSQTTISRCTDWYCQPVHTSPLLSTPPIFSTSGVQTVSTTDSARSKRGLEGGNLVSASTQQYIDSRDNHVSPSSLHSILEDDAPITRLSAVGGLKTHLNAGDPTQSESAASRSSNRMLNRVDHENVDSTPQRPLRSALGA